MWISGLAQATHVDAVDQLLAAVRDDHGFGSCQEESTVSILLSLHEAAYLTIDWKALRIRSRGDSTDVSEQVLAMGTLCVSKGCMRSRYTLLASISVNRKVLSVVWIYSVHNCRFNRIHWNWQIVHDYMPACWMTTMLPRIFGRSASSRATHSWDFIWPTVTSESKWVSTYEAAIHFKRDMGSTELCTRIKVFTNLRMQDFQGWSVRSGMIYGADFVLYKGHPSEVHADFCVSIVSSQCTLKWKDIQAMHRLCNQVSGYFLYRQETLVFPVATSENCLHNHCHRHQLFALYCNLLSVYVDMGGL